MPCAPRRALRPRRLAGSRRDVVWPRMRAPGQSNSLHDDFPGARGALDGELAENVVGKARNCLAPVRLAQPEDGAGDLLHADRADRIVEQRPLRPDSPLRRAETRAAIGVRSGHTGILASGAMPPADTPCRRGWASAGRPVAGQDAGSGRPARTRMRLREQARAASSRLRRHRHATQAPASHGQPGRRRPAFAATTIRST